MRKLKSVLGMLGTIALLAGCSGGIMDPKGQIGAEAKNLILTATGLMLIVVIPVIFMTFYFAWKYRHNRPELEKDYEPNWSHSYKIEFFMWAVPVVIIAILATITWRTSHSLDPYRPIESEKETMTIEVVSMDWKWLFIYPDEKVAVVNEMAIPVDTPVRFKITSNSVMNSFFIPQLGSQIYSMAAMQTQLHLIANEAGVYNGISSNYSGSGFSGMNFKVHALSTEEYQNWLMKVRESSQSLTLEEYKALSEPSKRHPVTYYADVKPGMFQYILTEFGDHFSHQHHSEMPRNHDAKMIESHHEHKSEEHDEHNGKHEHHSNGHDSHKGH